MTTSSPAPLRVRTLLPAQFHAIPIHQCRPGVYNPDRHQWARIGNLWDECRRCLDTKPILKTPPRLRVDRLFDSLFPGQVRITPSSPRTAPKPPTGHDLLKTLATRLPKTSRNQDAP